MSKRRIVEGIQYSNSISPFGKKKRQDEQAWVAGQSVRMVEDKIQARSYYNRGKKTESGEVVHWRITTS